MTTCLELSEFLRSATYCRLEIRRLEERIADLRDALTRVTPSYSDMPGGGSGDGESSRRLLANLADTETYLERQKNRLKKKYKQVDRFIDGLPDGVGKTMLRLRYLDGMSWPGIQAWMDEKGCCYSERQMFRIYRSAMQDAQTEWEKRQCKAKVNRERDYN